MRRRNGSSIGAARRSGAGLRFLDRHLGPPILRVLGLRRKASAAARPVQGFKKIGLLQTAAIGDTALMAGPLLDLRAAFPDSEITIFSGPDNEGIARVLPGGAKVRPLDSRRPLAALKIVREDPQDVLIDFGPWPRVNALITALSGARLTIGFESLGAYRHYAYDIVAQHLPDTHELDNIRKLVAPLYSGEPHAPVLACPPSDPLQYPFGNTILFHPWASGAGKRIKEWTTEHWSELSGLLAGRGFSIAITGGKKDVEDTEALAAFIREQHPKVDLTVLAGKQSIPQLMAALKAAAAVVSVNTGVMHIAACLGCPTVGLSGPTNPVRWGPIGPRAVSLSPDGGIYSYLHLGNEYPRNIEPCMPYLPPTKVFDATLALLAESASAPSEPGVGAGAGVWWRREA